MGEEQGRRDIFVLKQKKIRHGECIYNHYNIFQYFKGKEDLTYVVKKINLDHLGDIPSIPTETDLGILVARNREEIFNKAGTKARNYSKKNYFPDEWGTDICRYEFTDLTEKEVENFRSAYNDMVKRLLKIRKN